LSTVQNTPLAVTLTGSDVETPAGDLVFTITQLPVHGTLTDGGGTALGIGATVTGSPAALTYTPSSNWTGADDFTYTVSDTGSPALTAAATVSITVYDTLAPTATLSSALSDPTKVSPITVTVTFSEDVTGFDLADIVAGNATVGNLTGSGQSYTFDLTPSGQGLVTAVVVTGAAHDAAGNGNAASAILSRTYDSVAPTVTLASPAADVTAQSPIPVSVTFSEPVTGFTAADVAVSNGTVSNFSGSGASYTFDLVPSGVGPVTAGVSAGAAQDAAGNGNLAAIPFGRIFNNVERATAGVFDPGTAIWDLRNSNDPGAPDIAPFAYGAPAGSGWWAIGTGTARRQSTWSIRRP
jgi:hypothetical protein